jgi:hypothetical protein
VHGHAGDVCPLQLLADGFGLITIEAGEAGADQGLVAFRDRLGERIGLAQQALRRAARGVDPLLGLGLIVERADLDDPAAARRGSLARRL